MKRLKLLALMVVTSLTFILQSCLNDDSNDSFTISTIKTLGKDSKDFYFQLDNGDKMYPGELNAIGNYDVKDGQRAFVIFKELEKKVAGYDYNVEVKNIQDILTKDIVNLTEDNVEEIGDDPINLTYMWIAQGYLTIEFQYFGTHTENKKHFLNLVINQLSAATSPYEDGYIGLEFRHNKKGDSPEYLGEGYVSFKLDEIADQIKGKKGLEIRVNTIYNGVKHYKVDFPAKNNR